jgi:hypothetical protein
MQTGPRLRHRLSRADHATAPRTDMESRAKSAAAVDDPTMTNRHSVRERLGRGRQPDDRLPCLTCGYY